jgi:chromosome segregation ATPase
MNEMARNDELAEALERLSACEGAIQVLAARLAELESATLSVHERLSLAEACWERARDVLRAMAEGMEALLRRAAGGRPPSAPPPLSGVN